MLHFSYWPTWSLSINTLRQWFLASLIKSVHLRINYSWLQPEERKVCVSMQRSAHAWYKLLTIMGSSEQRLISRTSRVRGPCTGFGLGGGWNKRLAYTSDDECHSYTLKLNPYLSDVALLMIEIAVKCTQYIWTMGVCVQARIKPLIKNASPLPLRAVVFHQSSGYGDWRKFTVDHLQLLHCKLTPPQY